MRYKPMIWDNPISIIVNKPQLDQIVSELPSYATGKWKHIDRLIFETHEHNRVQIIIPYNDESWRHGYLEFGNSTTIRALEKDYLTVQERNCILDKFIKDVLEPYKKDHPDIQILYGVSGELK